VNLGLILGAALTIVRGRRRGYATRAIVDVVLAAAVGGLVLARAAHVAVHWDYYARHLGGALRPWRGGLMWHGALVGGVGASAIVCGIRGISLRRLLDAMTPGAAVLSACAWLACLMAGCAWGMETYPGDGVLWALSMDLPDLYGTTEPRVAVQLLGAAWSALILSITLGCSKPVKGAGSIFAIWLTLHGAGAFGLGLVRADPMPSVGSLRVDQLANLAVTGVGVLLLLAGIVRPWLRPRA